MAAETKAEAFKRLREANMWDKFQKRIDMLLKRFPHLDGSDVFNRVLREYPPAGTTPVPAYTDEEMKQLESDVRNTTKQRARMRIDGQVKNIPAAVAEARKVGFSTKQLNKIHKLPKGTPTEAVEFALANLYNPSLSPDDFPCTLAYTYWMLGQEDPKTLQTQALRLVGTKDETAEEDKELLADKAAQERLLDRLAEFHGFSYERTHDVKG